MRFLFLLLAVFSLLVPPISGAADPVAGASAPPAAAKIPDPCDKFAVAPQAFGSAPVKKPEDGYRYVQECARGTNWKKVDANKEMQKLIKGLATTVGQNLPVYSCFRNQQSQDEILCRAHCAPRFGDRKCEGRVAANLSEHTVGIAADTIIQTAQTPTSTKEQLRQESFRMCGLLNQNRKQNNAGWGGITVYGVEPKDGKAYVHMDIKKDWCNWGDCQDLPSLGEGNCKRTTYRVTNARLMQKLADAKKAEAMEDVKRLQGVLAKLHADCKPGDLKCRDLFKTL